MKGYKEIGHTKKTRGVAGELKVHISDPFLSAFLRAEVIFLELQGGPVPFFVEQIREAGDLIVKLDEVDTPEEAVPLAGKPIYLPDEAIEVSTAANTIDWSVLEGYAIIDEAAGPVGRIEEVLELPQQMMAVVQYEGREVLIPLAEQWITEADAEERTLRMKLPEGLLEL